MKKICKISLLNHLVLFLSNVYFFPYSCVCMCVCICFTPETEIKKDEKTSKTGKIYEVINKASFVIRARKALRCLKHWKNTSVPSLYILNVISNKLKYMLKLK